MWKETLESKRLRISRSKTEYIKFNFGARLHGRNREMQVMKTNGDVVSDVVERFKYQGTVL